MGYDVYYKGEARITPALTAEHRAVLEDLSDHSGYGATPRNTIAAELNATITKANGDYLCRMQVVPSEDKDGSFLTARDGAERGQLEDWLEGLIEHFFAPNGYVLEGKFSYSGDDYGDQGVIYVRGMEVETVQDIAYNPGPSWNRQHTFAPEVKVAIEAVVSSADNTGCSDDLTVASKSSIDLLAKLIQPAASI